MFAFDVLCQRIIVLRWRIFAPAVGIRLNGRNYAQGSHIAFLPKVPRRGNLEGVGGLDGSSTSHCIGTIQMFYTCEMVSLVPGRPSTATFLDVIVRPKLRTWQDIFILENDRQLVGTEKIGFNHVHSPVHKLIHVDSITSKVMLVPHFQEEKTHEMCAIRMWDAR